MRTHSDGMSQVVILDALMPSFEEWLADRGCHLFRIPGMDPDDLTTYSVGINPCGARGPRIGDDGVMICVLMRGHVGRHCGDSSWERITNREWAE